MTRAEIKEKAKKTIKGNLWNIWWPLLVIAIVETAFEYIFGVNSQIKVEDLKVVYSLSASSVFGSIAMAIVGGILTAGYLKYVVNFIRTGRFESDDIIDTIKTKWLDILICVALTTVVVTIGYVLFVIPGIILSFAYALAIFLVIDKGVKGQDSLKTSRILMKGHKFDMFIMGLSFIGWCILVPLTLGILAIWLVPYVIVTFAIYYDYLTKDYNGQQL